MLANDIGGMVSSLLISSIYDTWGAGNVFYFMFFIMISAALTLKMSLRRSAPRKNEDQTHQTNARNISRAQS
jgi:sugar phosphate permease